MSEEHDPRGRLEGDPAFAELHAGLRSARERGPSAEQTARMRAALGLPAPIAPATEPDTAAPRTPAARPGWLKLIVYGALAIGAAFGVWRVALDGAQLELSHDNTAPRTAPPPPVVVPSAATPLAAPNAIATSPIAQDTAGSAAERGASARLRRTAPRVMRSAPPSSEAEADPGAELALLKRAKADARSAPANALALVAEHEQRFPRGVLVEEREVIAIEALLASGERAAAEARAVRFFARFPNSAHTRRVHALLEDPNAPQSDTKPSVAPHPSR